MAVTVFFKAIVVRSSFGCRQITCDIQYTNLDGHKSKDIWTAKVAARKTNTSTPTIVIQTTRPFDTWMGALIELAELLRKQAPDVCARIRRFPRRMTQPAVGVRDGAFSSGRSLECKIITEHVEWIYIFEGLIVGIEATLQQ
ncbi:hypothetical protein E8E11_008232 [Didymella keratinophila]|nr:hypothetical protein E8E11_008232 [Didymella keratinophila]